MKLKLDDAGNVVLRDGKPVYIADDGKELALDAASLYAAVAELGVAERAAAQKLKQKDAELAKFAGVDLDKLRFSASAADDIGKSYQAKIEAEAARATMAENKLAERIRASLFAQSAYIAKNSALPADFVESRFASNFKVGPDGSIEPIDSNGRPIYSRAHPAQLASFDEAIEQIISAHPQRDSILKGSVLPGAGTPPTPGSGGAKTIPEAAFNALSGKEQNAKLADGFTIS